MAMEFFKLFQEITIGPYFFVWIGSLIGHVLSLYDKSFQGSKVFLRGVIPNQSDTFYNRLDFIVLPIIGTVLAVVLISPSDPKTGVFSGLSWSGSLLAMLKRNPSNVINNSL
jgi:hypothetical protein